MTTGPLPILTYHSIDTSGSVISISPTCFENTMRGLLEAGFEAVDLETWISTGGQGPERGFAVTFDDGLASSLRAAEVLANLGIPATMFLVSGRMSGDNRWPGQPPGIPRLDVISWRDARDLRAAGVRFGAHSQTHPDLRQLDDAAVLDEMQASRDAIESRLGEPCRLFAYPYGRSSPRIQRLARNRFEAAVGTRLDLAEIGENPFDLPRLDAYYLRDRRSLDALISGRWREHSRVARWLRSARQGARHVYERGFVGLTSR